MLADSMHFSDYVEQLTYLLFLKKAEQGSDMDFPGWRLHPLKGDLADHWSVWVNGNWRMTFTFKGGNAVLVDYQDYHGD